MTLYGAFEDQPPARLLPKRPKGEQGAPSATAVGTAIAQRCVGFNTSHATLQIAKALHWGRGPQLCFYGTCNGASSNECPFSFSAAAAPGRPGTLSSAWASPPTPLNTPSRTSRAVALWSAALRCRSTAGRLPCMHQARPTLYWATCQQAVLLLHAGQRRFGASPNRVTPSTWRTYRSGVSALCGAVRNWSATQLPQPQCHLPVRAPQPSSQRGLVPTGRTSSWPSCSPTTARLLPRLLPPSGGRPMAAAFAPPCLSPVPATGRLPLPTRASATLPTRM